MFYTPTPPAISSRARALAEELQQTIDEYRKKHPELEDREVASALRSVAARSGTSVGPKWRIIAFLVLGVLGGLVLLLISTMG